MTSITRRRVLAMLGAAGGSAAVFHGASAIGLAPAAETATLPGRMLPPRPPGAPMPRIVVLGAGIGGLCAAFELEQAGYEVVVLEASHHIGGRNLTARRGTVIDELGNRQVCEFDDHPDLYFNAGPARIPAMHHRLMNYCREFNVQLEPFINSNYNAWVVDGAIHAGRPMRQRDVIADARGFLSELAAKGANRAALDAPMSEEDFRKLTDYVRAFGDLNPDSMTYTGTARAGFMSDGMLDPVTLKPYGSLKQLLESSFVMGGMLFAEGEYQSPSMMQPVGGMDRIVDAFVRRLQQAVITRARVVEIDQRTDSIAVHYEQGDRLHTVEADYCLNSIPGHLMQGISHNLSASYTALMGKIQRGKLSKVGFQMNSRFWEDEGIYGGISWTDDPVLQLWYPSHGAQQQKGIMLGAYIFDPDDNADFGRLSHAQRLEHATRAGEQLHPGKYRTHIESGVSVVWHRMNHLLGCGGGVGDAGGSRGMFDIEADRIRTELLKGDGRHFVIGDQVSKHPGWQEGALAVSERVLQQLHERSRTAGPGAAS